LKAMNFRNSKKKLAYMYLLTPAGVEEKSSITLRFLKSKMREYELLKLEINLLIQETKSELILNQTSDMNLSIASVEGH
ncbi:MAG: hypothetical protein K5Q00_04350, partial [Gammaproteobacteria bacterium]|nr:hypothetical protein [Gammaproteobacteria bacterium]